MPICPQRWKVSSPSGADAVGTTSTRSLDAVACSAHQVSTGRAHGSNSPAPSNAIAPIGANDIAPRTESERSDGDGEACSETSSFADTAVDLDRRVHPIAQLFDDVQPDPEPPGRSRRRRIGLEEPVEDAVQEVLRDAAAVVFNGERDRIAVRARNNGDLAALRRELTRVTQQVAHDLMQTVAVDHRLR